MLCCPHRTLCEVGRFPSRPPVPSSVRARWSQNRAFAQKVEEMFDEDLKNCKEITYEAFDHRGLAKRMSELISYIWEPYY